MKQSLAATAAVILAAGKGKRLGGTTSKVLRPLLGRPMISYIIETLEHIPVTDIYVVTGHQAEDVQGALGRKVKYVNQREQLGTAHAVQTALTELPVDIETVIVLNGDDSAFYDLQTIRRLLASHLEHDSVMTLLSAHVDNPTGLGRIVREQGKVVSIVEEKDATKAQQKLNEINTGCYIFDANWLRATLPKIGKSKSGEYYLVDTLRLAIESGKPVNIVELPGERKWWGINTPRDLEKANQLMFNQVSRRLKPKVFFLDFDNTLINTQLLKKEGMTDAIRRFFARNIGEDKADIQTKLYWQLYDKVKKEQGGISVPDITVEVVNKMQLPELAAPFKRVLYNLPFKSYVFDGVVDTLEFLDKFAKLVIASETDIVYGSAKIRGSGLAEKVSEIHIYQSKKQAFPELIKLYQDYEIYIVDDQLTFLEALHELAPCTSFWIDNGPYQGRKSHNPSFRPTHTISKFQEIEAIVRTWE